MSDVAWSKIQHQSTAVLETQAYAIRQLGDIADKLEEKRKVGEIAKTASEAEVEVGKWLAVLARCVHLHDGIAILELDRVMDTSPAELDRHRLGLETARRERLELLSTCTETLLTRMNAAVETANSKVLFNPTSSPSVIESRNLIVADVHEFRGVLGVDSGVDASEAKRWKDAASESLESARTTGAKGLESARNLGTQGLETAKGMGSGTRDQARTARRKVAEGISRRKLRRRRED